MRYTTVGATHQQYLLLTIMNCELLKQPIYFSVNTFQSNTVCSSSGSRRDIIKMRLFYKRILRSVN